MRLRRLAAGILGVLVAGGAAHASVDPATTTKHPASKTAAKTPGEIKRAPAAKPYKTKTRSKKTKASARSGAKSASVKSTAPVSSGATAHSKTVVLRTPPPTVATREVMTDHIERELATPRVGIENPRALAGFFDQLHQLEAGPKSTLVRVIQFGDSHTAADVFTGALRTLFQSKFGDGGAGFSYAGYPFAGYRIHGTRRAQSTGWTVLGTHLNDIGDGMVGMGGVSLSTEAPGNWVSLDADATSLQVQYLIQPNGGSFEIRDNDTLIATVSTAKSDPSAPDAAAQFGAPVEPGPHHFEVLTIDQAPVRLLGLATEN